MNALTSALAALNSPDARYVAIEITAKVTLVLLIAALVATALRRSTAAVRYRVWQVAIAGSLLMPVFLALPHFSMRVPWQWLPAVPQTSTGTVFKALPSAQPASTNERAPNGTMNVRSTAARFADNGPQYSAGNALSAPDGITPSVRSAGALRPDEHRAAPYGVAVQAARIPLEQNSSARVSHAVGAWLWTGWALGACLLLLWYAIGHLQLARLLRRTTHVSNPNWQDALQAISETLSISRHVRLVMHDEARTPMTAGWLHPVIVLPPDLESYSEERRTAVLLHELAHVARQDYATRNMTSVATALFWFHPAMWFGATRLHAEGERAADDCVLLWGMPADRYATQLLALAHGARRTHFASARGIGMARTSQLETRIRAMLDVAQKRASAGTPWQTVCGYVSLMAIAPLAALRFQSADVSVARLEYPDVPRHLDQAPAQLHVKPAIPLAELSQPYGNSNVRLQSANASANRMTGYNRDAVTDTSAQPEVITMNVSQVPTDGTGNAVALQTDANRVQADTAFEQTLDAKAGELLDLHVLSGADIIVHGWDEPRARLRVSLGGPHWRATPVVFRRTASGMQLFSATETNGAKILDPKKNPDGYLYLYPYVADGTDRTRQAIDHRFELWVPRRTNIKLTSWGGSLAIQDLQGDFQGSTKRGSLDVQNSSGSANLETLFGEVNVTMSELSGTITTQCGRVLLAQVTGGLRTSTAFDPPALHDAPNRPLIIIDGFPAEDYCRLKSRTSAGPRVDEHWPYGNVAIDSAPNGGTLSTRSGSVSVGSSGGVITASSGKGDIELSNMTGDAVAFAKQGNVLIRVVNVNGLQHYITARAANGEVVVELPDSLDATLDIQSSYTQAYIDSVGHGTSINIDRTLGQNETGAWIMGRGYGAQRYVRAARTLGRGNGRVYIRAVNGNVTVRRRTPG